MVWPNLYTLQRCVSLHTFQTPTTKKRDRAEISLGLSLKCLILTDRFFGKITEVEHIKENIYKYNMTDFIVEILSHFYFDCEYWLMVKSVMFNLIRRLQCGPDINAFCSYMVSSLCLFGVLFIHVYAVSARYRIQVARPRWLCYFQIPLA